MKKFLWSMLLCGIFFWSAGMQTDAKEDVLIHAGVYLDEIDVSGMTREEAEQEIQNYARELSQETLTLQVEEHEVQVQLSDLGLTCSNPEIVEEAADIGQTGNVVARYKAAKDLQYQNKVFHMEFDADREQIRQILEQQCAVYNVEAKDATLSRVNGSFVINEGQTGKIIDVEASTQLICDYFNSDWNEEEGGSIELIISVDEPQGTAEELGKVKDVLGTFTTSYRTSGSARSANVANGCALINGTTLYPGDEFSTCEAITPFTSENGYYMAASYLNGQVVDSLGGGICQVSSTIHVAMLLAGITPTQRYAHSLPVDYVPKGLDSAIVEGYKDLTFTNNFDFTIVINATVKDGVLTVSFLQKQDV